jgi:hypothetical protein
MRSRRIRREAVYWTVAAVAAAVIVFGLVQVGSTAWRDVGVWWRARLTHRPVVDTMRPETLALIAVNTTKSDKVATDLGLVQIVPRENRVRGVVFPGNTFVEVPGQGFEAAAEAFRGGPEDAIATIQNLIGVPLTHYIVLDATEFKALSEQGQASSLFSRPLATDLSPTELARLKAAADKVKAGDALMVPLPVKTISVGSDIYYQAEKDKIADVLKAWWGISSAPESQPVRVKILNGAGQPGIGGEAAKPLIRAGFRVIDTTNADRFNYPHTLIVTYRMDTKSAEAIRKVLGVGRIVVGTMAQDVVDVIVVIGKDFKPHK